MGHIVLTDHDTFFRIRFCKIFKGFKKAVSVSFPSKARVR